MTEPGAFRSVDSMEWNETPGWIVSIQLIQRPLTVCVK